MSRFSIKDLLLLILVIALGVGLYISNRDLVTAKNTLRTERDKFRFLNVEDPRNIASTRLPKIEGNLWQWRIHIPSDGSYMVRAAYNDLLPMRPPRTTNSKIDLHLNSGESLLSASLKKNNGEWTLFVSIESETDLGSGNHELILCTKTDWIDNNVFGTMTAGDDGTEERDPDKPYFLVQIRDSTEVQGKPPAWNDPAEGVILWIDKSK